MRYWLAANESTLVEQPGVLTMKLLIAVVGQNRGIDLVGDAEHKRIATTNCAGWRSDQFVVADRLVELGHLGWVDSMSKGGVHHNGDQRIRVFAHVRQYGVVQLL